MEFDVNVWGWFPENEYEYGGSPEHDAHITVTAETPEAAVELACNKFDAEHSFEHVKGEIRA